MDSETQAFLEKYFGLIQLELEKTNERIMSTEESLRAEMREGFRSTGESLRAEMREGLTSTGESLRAEMREGLTSTEESLRTEIRERSISTDEQLRTLTMRIQHFEGRVESSLAVISRDVDGIRQNVGQMTVRMKNVETGIGDLNARVDVFADDMRQRFRAVR